ncbi:MAG: hypothetical protein HYV67_04545 [Candidatus Taylorbacteria bacterium]|nr:hypothetical protein [Candidatus Taylorbacteria bacterium]
MKNLRENWCTISILLLILLVIFLFQKPTPRIFLRGDNLNASERCSSKSAETFQYTINQRQQVFGSISYQGYQNHYNSNLNKCFVTVTYYADGNHIELLDSYENSALAGCTYRKSKDNICFVENNFDATRDEVEDYINARMENTAF